MWANAAHAAIVDVATSFLRILHYAVVGYCGVRDEL
jgi:hypothetical protein